MTESEIEKMIQEGVDKGFAMVEKIQRYNKIKDLIKIALKTLLITGVTMLSIMTIWIYTPYETLFKAIFTIVYAIIIYDLFKNYIYTRYILWKET